MHQNQIVKCDNLKDTLACLKLGSLKKTILRLYSVDPRTKIKLKGSLWQVDVSLIDLLTNHPNIRITGIWDSNQVVIDFNVRENEGIVTQINWAASKR